ncbi:MAG: hypothetical protein B7C24_11235 [Bacteroidetes bacterium 4572_77]|nr:MAG: hypothetical protein B7C24_11235 [Bacteroidetes bacterium 4572_77]
MKTFLLFTCWLLIAQLSDAQDYMGVFDGSTQWAYISNSDDINTSGSGYANRTFEIWFKADDLSISDEQVLYEEGGGNNGMCLYIYEDSLFFGIWSNIKNKATWQSFIPVAIEEGVWYHAAMVLESAASLGVYLNGDSVGGVSSANSFDRHSNAIRIGCCKGTKFSDRVIPSTQGDKYFFDGRIDEIRIWNLARTTAQIRENMCRELLSPSTESQLVCCLSFSEGSGTTINDASSYNNDGYLDSSSHMSWNTSTAPIPFFSLASGNWNSNAVWASGQQAPERDWDRVQIKHDVDLSSDEECEELSIDNGASLSIQAEKTLLVNSTISNNAGEDGLILESSSQGLSALVHNTDNVEATVHTYFNTLNKWYLISPPISNALADVFLDEYLDYWDEPTKQWIGIEDETTSLIAAQGYAVKKTQGNTATYKGYLNNGSITLTGLDYTAANPDSLRGWNLVGNPYPSVIAVDSIEFGSQIVAGASVWPHMGTYSASYYSWSQGSGTGDPEARYIQPGQGFMIQLSSNNQSLTFENNYRINSQLGSLDKDLKEDICENNVLKIAITQNHIAVDKTYICFREAASPFFDNYYDMHKLFGAGIHPQIFSYVDLYSQEKLCINAIAPPHTGEYIPLGLRINASGSYTLSATGMHSFANTQAFVLLDRINDELYELHKDSIVVFDHINGDTEHRFDLLFDFSSSLNNRETDEDLLYCFNNRIYFKQAASCSQIQIYNTIGQEMKHFNKNEIHQGLYVDLPPAYYLIKAQFGQKTIVLTAFVK